MDRTYWHKQAAGKPLFPDLLWSRPETKATAGKLLIIGGNQHSFAAPAIAFANASQAGIGTTRILLPEPVRKLLPVAAPEMEFAPGNASGSFARTSLSAWLNASIWADGVLLAGDFGRNSETAIVLEQFIQKHRGQITITQDAADYFTKAPGSLLQRPETTLVISFAQTQKLAMSAKFPQAFTFDMDFLHLIDTLHDFTEQHQAHIITKHLDTIFVAVKGQVSTTKLSEDLPVWRVATASHAAVWWLQNPSKAFAALATSCINVTL